MFSWVSILVSIFRLENIWKNNLISRPSIPSERNTTGRRLLMIQKPTVFNLLNMEVKNQIAAINIYLNADGFTLKHLRLVFLVRLQSYTSSLWIIQIINYRYLAILASHWRISSLDYYIPYCEPAKVKNSMFIIFHVSGFIKFIHMSLLKII